MRKSLNFNGLRIDFSPRRSVSNRKWTRMDAKTRRGRFAKDRQTRAEFAKGWQTAAGDGGCHALSRKGGGKRKTMFSLDGKRRIERMGARSAGWFRRLKRKAAKRRESEDGFQIPTAYQSVSGSSREFLEKRLFVECRTQRIQNNDWKTRGQGELWNSWNGIAI